MAKNPEAAKARRREIISDYPDTSVAGEAKRLLAELGASQETDGR